ncbi:uncharacterized protein LOC5517355 [Nematostella vectensis]|nr:uncharacterized protein LOC5517355 [Nematostella vectensis]
MDQADSETENLSGRKITRTYWKRYFRSPGLNQVNTFDSGGRGQVCGQYDATSAWARRLQTLKILSVSIIAVLGLLAFVSIDVYRAQGTIRKERDIQKGLGTSIAVAELIHTLQIERGTTVLCISSPNSTPVGKDLNKARLNTDKNIKSIINWPEGRQSLQSREIFIRDVTDFRSRGEVERCVLNITIQETLNFYTGLIDTMIDWLFVSIKSSKGESVLFELLGYRMFLIAKEKTGLERAMGGSYFSRGYFNKTEELILYAEHNVIGKMFLNSSMEFMPKLKTYYTDTVSKETGVFSSLIDTLNAKRAIILSNEQRQANVTEGQNWFKLMTNYIDILLTVQEKAGENLIFTIEESIDDSENDLIIRAVTLFVVVALTPILFVTVARMTNTIHKYGSELAKTTRSLKEEQQRTDELLSAMFPRSVAETLKLGEKVPSEHFDSVTVFFSDIVDFTNMCAMISPMSVTQMLNDVYSVFDDHIEKYDVYKVETIGDAYMVVSGLPLRNGTSHADEIGRMSLDLVRLTETTTLDSVPKGKKLMVRVGIHTGPCVSGVVGYKMPRYCLFGDTVNTASRMQTTGIPQKVHISETTYDLLTKFNTFHMEYRGTLEVKGKGLMRTYWLLGHEATSKNTEDLPGLLNEGFEPCEGQLGFLSL